MSKITLHQGDCLGYLKTLAPGSVDAVVTDPPYGMNALDGSRSNRYGINRRKNWDCSRVDTETFNAILNISSTAIIWGMNYYCDMLPPHKRFMTWNKTHVAHLPNWGAAELAYTNLKGNALAFSCSCDKDKQHPTQKPIRLMEWCLSFLPAGCTVLDPFMGSGTTGVACVRTGRNFIGCEIDPGYFAIAQKRIADEQAKTALLEPCEA